MAKVGPIDIIEIKSGLATSKPDLLANEEPLEIRIGYGPLEKRQEKRIAVTMRTQGDDIDLSYGFLLTEGIVSSPSDLLRIRHCKDVKEEEVGNVVRAELKPDVAFSPEIFDRNFYMSSSCGVCGKSSIESVESAGCAVLPSSLKINFSEIFKLPGLLFHDQSVFKHTGGIHAAGIFTPLLAPLVIKEDIGRHNAVDKAIGSRWIQNNGNFSNELMVVSGRAGFEIVQKTIVAGIEIMVAIGAPSSLSVQLARRFNLSLLGFTSEKKFNIYSGEERIIKPKANETTN